MQKQKHSFKLEDQINISDSSIENDQLKEDKSLVVDKVVRILRQIKVHLDTTLASRELIRNLNWTIQKIENNSLYTIALDEIFDEEEYDNAEQKEFLENFQDFSFVNSIHKQTRERVICKTAHNSDLIDLKKMRDNLEIKRIHMIFI